MLKQTITFRDFNGVERTEDLYFNLTEWELTDIQADSEHGIQKDMQDAIAAKDLRKLLDFIKMLVHAAYGERDRDGIHFNKSPEITERFINSAMYSPLLLSLFEDEGKRTEAFITGLMPADLVQRAIAATQGRQPQDFLKKAQPESAFGIKETPVIGTPSPSIAEVDLPTRNAFEQNVASAPAPEDIVPNPPVSPPAPVQLGRVEEAQIGGRLPDAFRVQETPLDPTGAPVTDDEAAAWADFQRRRAAGEL